MNLREPNAVWTRRGHSKRRWRGSGYALPTPTLYERVGKPILDVLIAVIALTLLSPILLIVGVLIVADDGLPVLFRQQRVGIGSRTFTLLKLRTMRRDTPHMVSTMANPAMITRAGRVLRRANLDEVPQLMNVLRRDMSIVGPRPALPSQEHLIALRSASGAIRCRPGLTGLAQVNSYDGMPDEEKARNDAMYSNSVSLKSDLKILLRTFGYLLRRPPVY